jgi:sugar phosphate isomerase/epimerase
LRACQASVFAAAAVPLASTATEPIKRSGTPKFKFSLAAYSYRTLLTGKEPKLTLFDFVDDCAKMQLEGTELTSYYFPEPTTPEYLRKLRAHCFRLGLDVSGTAVRNEFGHPAGEQRQRELDLMKQGIDNAAMLGAPVIRIFAGHVQKSVSPEESHKLMVAGMEESCAYAAERGVFLALELRTP